MLAKCIFRYLFLLLTLVVSVSFSGNNFLQPLKRENRVLVFSKTNAFRHASIADGIEAIRKIGEANNFDVDATEDSLAFTPENLQQYKAVIFLHTTGNILGETQQLAFEDYIHKGGGFAGIHGASDCEYQWPWYVKMVGASFDNHPKQQDAVLRVVNKKHASTKGLPQEWKRFDEWYNFKNLNKKVKVLIKLDEQSYQGGKHGKNHPIAWYHAYAGGRAFYTALGHTKEAYTEPLFLQHITGGIKYAMNIK